MAYAQILQRLLQRFFATQGRAPITPMDWSKLRRQAMELARKEGGDPITGLPQVSSKTTLEDFMTGPHLSKGPKGTRMWDFSPKKGEVIPFPHKGIRSLIKKGDVTVGTAPRTKKSTLKAKKDRHILLRDADEDIARIKRENKEAVDRFRKKMNENEPDKFQFGGIAPLIGEPSYAANFYDDRTPMKKGKKAKKKKKTAAEVKADLVKKIKKKGKKMSPEEKERILRLMMSPWRQLPHGRQRYRSIKDLPEGILELLQKDPGFDREAFEKAHWAGKGWRHTDPGWRSGMRGSYSPMTGAIELNLAPFGEKEYTKFRAKSPHLPDRFLTDTDKAKIALHELRHKNIMEDQNLFKTQPEWVQRSEGAGYLPKGGVTGHELYNRFLDKRYYPPEEDPGPNDPYFDKILKDYWEPYAQDYEKTAKRRLSERHGEGIETLASQGGRIGLAGGGALFKFIEKLFIKASNDIRLGRGKWKGLDQKQIAVQHDNLTKKVTEFQKTGNTEGLEVYFGVNPEKAFAEASKKVKSPLQREISERTGKVFDPKTDQYVTPGKKIDKDRLATADELEDAREIVDPSGEAYMVEEGMTVKELDKMVAEHKAYEADMYREYMRGDLEKYVKSEELE